LSRKQADDELDQQIITAVKNAKPETIQQLIDHIQTISERPKQEILNRITRLQQEEKIRLKPAETQQPQKLTSYLTSNHARWYWITIVITVVTAIVVLAVPESASPIVYLRNILGTLYVLGLPGYAFIKALFPQNLPFSKIPHSPSTAEKELDIIERIALSIGMSIALVPIVGLLLYYSPLRLNLEPTVLSIMALTIVFATAAVIREQKTGTMKSTGP
jgi:hypothetical protein